MECPECGSKLEKTIMIGKVKCPECSVLYSVADLVAARAFGGDLDG